MSAPYVIEFTHAAKVEAQKSPGGLASVETRVRAEIDRLMEDWLYCLTDLCFLTIGDNQKEFFCMPESDEKLIVDACEQVEIGELDRGPLAAE